jgi:hypothetical protein
MGNPRDKVNRRQFSELLPSSVTHSTRQMRAVIGGFDEDADSNGGAAPHAGSRQYSGCPGAMLALAGVKKGSAGRRSPPLLHQVVRFAICVK